MAKHIVTRAQVRPGDILLDYKGDFLTRVVEVHDARARGYVVWYCEGEDGRRMQNAGGNKTGTVSIERMS